jgi:Fe2+ transport system protein FeoA
MICTLNELKKKNEATIVNLNCDHVTQQQFMEEGFIPGTKISIDGVSPFGGPILCLLRNCKVALRLQDAESITVEL